MNNDFEILRNICEDALYTKYKSEDAAKKRMETELHLIDKNDYAYKYLLYRDIIEKNGLRPSQYSIRGCGAGSIVCYLLDISKTDPMDDRFPLYYEFFMGYDGTGNHCVEFNVDQNVYNKVAKYVNEIDPAIENVNILAHDTCTLVADLERKTGYYPTDEDIHSEVICSLFQSNDALHLDGGSIFGINTGLLGIPGLDKISVLRMIEELKPKTFSDMAKLECLYHGTDVWYTSGEYLVLDGKESIESLVGSREDMFESLLSYGFPRETAFSYAEILRKGFLAKSKLDFDMEAELSEYGVEDWRIWHYSKIKYLFPRAHTAEYLQMELRALYYKLHYPEEYYPLYFELFGNELMEDYYFYHPGDDDFSRIMLDIEEGTVDSLYQYLVWNESRSRWVP